ncbi:SDR family NAD(P)-dependent oxidoreductase [Aspergillus glaucus CBS 516.65]|uniref:Uncharacterized protein n=1 Tax=Aspergillus glaucus CBS 516.65 TaxID=1160497 RepID=A0A1L9VA20_ASPGL|nr:hypothetical protein ASPGLDRAFT_51180 [Aspergillus glaucus CBS 516.65]OJJ80749.1 hypothetical protein ASPGLDRAFT_51180 [Aspergillus glaucus CBS 516.65]
MNLTGYAFIVGGGGGIGSVCALAFAQDGAAGLLVADLSLESAHRIAVECQRAATHPSFRAEALHIDVSQGESVKRATAHMVQTFGRIDCLVNCAGIGVERAVEIADANADEFCRFLDVNTTGSFMLVREVSAIMKSQELRIVDSLSEARGKTRGSIVILGSASSFVATPGMVQYTTSKHAVLGFVKNAALDNAPHGIRVNCVCPSWVDTPMIQRAIESGLELDQLIKTVVPMGRIATPDEVADAVVFLSSSRSSYFTGCGFIMDGGTTLTCHV